jgi:carboxypeptidase family protein/TonB-dependent receptor-like protein
MTYRVRDAFGRVLVSALAPAVALLLAASSLAAQGTTGKIEGTVTDPQGAPVASAQVTVVGTAFGALSSDKGYYFINNVPVGTYTLRARFIGYTPAEVPGVRVLGSQTITANIKLTPSAVAIGPVTVEAAANPIVPRDQVTSKTIVSGDQFNRLPVGDTREVIALEPGVVESNNRKGLSLRGGRPGEAAVYIDGVLVRNSQRGETELTLGTNAVEEASVTTGAIGAEFGDAQSGILSFVTRAGGQKYQGSLSYATDDVGSLWNNVGFNRVEASIGGPIKGNLTFFVSGTVTGQKSFDTQKNRDIDRPIFVMSGVDTVVSQPETWGDDPTDSVQTAIPRFVQYSGTCGEYGAVAAPTGSAAQTIRQNFGVECQGLRLPFSANGLNTANAKLQYTYGSGSRVSVSALASSARARVLPLTQLYNPSAYIDTSRTSYAGILNWTQNLSRSAERAMALDLNVSYQIDKQLVGPLTRQSELDSRDPFGGFMLKPLDHLFDFNYRHTVKIQDSTYQNVGLLDDIQIQCIQAGEGSCRDDVPFLQRGDLDAAQPYRMNPYGVEQTARFPMWTQGILAALDLSREARWQARANFDWQADRFNRIKLGGEFHRIDTRRYNAGSGAISSFGINAYHETPIRYGAYVEDRLDLGDVVIVGGLRYDFYDSRAQYPLVPGRISTDSGSFDPYNPAAKFLAAPSHNAWSPRVQVSFPVTERTNFRLSYAHQVQQPDYDLMFRGINTDLTVTNRNQSFGRDLEFGKTIIFEFGIRHAFSQDMVLDIAAYNKDKVSDLAGRLVQLRDPGQNLSTGDFRVFTNADFGNVRGVDVRLDRRFSNLFSGAVAYTFQVAKNTGSDPFSYFNTVGRQISTLTGETSPPPQAILPTDDNRAHNIVGSASLSFPADWRKGTTVGTVFRNVGAFVTFRFQSGLPYTRVFPSAEGVTPDQGFGLEATQIEPINTSTRPWFKNVDLRLTKGFRLGALDWTLFGEAKNLFDFKNVISLFSESGDVTYKDHQDRYLNEQVQLLTTEAGAAAALVGDDVDFNLLGGCEFWQGRNAGNFASGPVDCVLLQRAEARYGDGDGVFTKAEYTAAFTAWYNLQNAPSRFYGPGRRIRLGLEISF